VYPETILGPGCDIARFARLLDELGHTGRVDTLHRLDPVQLAALYEAAKGIKPISLEHFVPGDVPALTEVIHRGKNSLPVFAEFDKHFARPDGEDGVLVGLNHQWTSVFTGPGYFVVRPSTTEGGAVEFDYTVQPKTKPAAWPNIVGQRGIGWFVYGGMLDIVRGVSEHVCVARAFRRGKAMDNYFALCRTVVET
jgi:hypothetical protein